MINSDFSRPLACVTTATASCQHFWPGNTFLLEFPSPHPRASPYRCSSPTFSLCLWSKRYPRRNFAYFNFRQRFAFASGDILLSRTVRACQIGVFQLGLAFWRDCHHADSKILAGDVVLHANLRNTILRPISLGMGLQQGNDERHLRTRLAVAFTSRQIYLEVAPIYYGENTFLWSGTSTLCHHAIESFANAVGPDNATTITALSLYDNWYPGNKYLSMLPGLKRLHIRRSGSMEAPKRMAKYARDHAALIVIYDGVILNPKSPEERGLLRSSV